MASKIFLAIKTNKKLLPKVTARKLTTFRNSEFMIFKQYYNLVNFELSYSLLQITGKQK